MKLSLTGVRIAGYSRKTLLHDRPLILEQVNTLQGQYLELGLGLSRKHLAQIRTCRVTLGRHAPKLTG